MDDKNQFLNSTGEVKRVAVQSATCPVDQPLATPDHPRPRAADAPPEQPPAHPALSPDSTTCRECLAAVAHRLAQPITALRGGIELGLMGKRSAADYRCLLEQTLQLADQMAQLIVSLRDLSESSAPGGPSQCIPLEATASEVLAELQGLAEAREIRLQFKAEESPQVCANPERLREALQSLLGWVIQNSAGDGAIDIRLSASEREAQVFLSPPRLDLQYLQIKVLEEITTPGLLFSHAAKHGALGWAINRRLIEGLGGRLEILTDGPAEGCIRARFPLAPANRSGDTTTLK